MVKQAELNRRPKKADEQAREAETRIHLQDFHEIYDEVVPQAKRQNPAPKKNTWAPTYQPPQLTIRGVTSGLGNTTTSDLGSLCEEYSGDILNIKQEPAKVVISE